jgi:hypothetical protein
MTQIDGKFSSVAGPYRPNSWLLVPWTLRNEHLAYKREVTVNFLQAEPLTVQNHALSCNSAFKLQN